jgi:hypothetical protein
MTLIEAARAGIEKVRLAEWVQGAHLTIHIVQHKSETTIGPWAILTDPSAPPELREQSLLAPLVSDHNFVEYKE